MVLIKVVETVRNVVRAVVRAILEDFSEVLSRVTILYRTESSFSTVRYRYSEVRVE